MNANMELIKYIYNNSNMGITSLTALIKDLNNKDNKIKTEIEEELKNYEKYLKTTKKILKTNKVEISQNNPISQIGIKMGIKKEVLTDNSDSSVAKLLIQGLTMGITDIETNMISYKDQVDKKYIKIADDFLCFHKESIDRLKKHYL